MCLLSPLPGGPFFDFLQSVLHPTMKNFIAFFFVCSFLLLASAVAQSQSIQNWTKTDCDGQKHTLFSELDSGNVVIMDFAMTHCLPCSTATAALTQLHAGFEATNPGNVRHYAIGYIDDYTCN